MNEKVSTRTKWFYGFGDIGFSVTNTILGVYFALFLTDAVGVKASVAALAISIGSTWDYINDPLGIVADLSLTGKDNPDNWDLAHHMGAKIYKRYRYYMKGLSATSKFDPQR